MPIILLWVFALLAIAGFVIAWYATRQRRKTLLKNRMLSKQLKDAAERYEELQRQLEALQADSHTREEIGTPIGQEISLNQLSPEELFHYINYEVRQRLLFLNPSFDRQTIMDEFHISKERVGSAFSQGSKYDSLPQFVCDLRLEYASKLLVSTDLSITEIMTKAGFSNASVFSRYFSRKYQVSPSQYRRTNREHHEGQTHAE